MALERAPSARLKQMALERAQPLSASLELTYRCNWRCVFCYNPRHHDRRGLSGAEWRAVLDELRALGTLSVALTGGEPLTHPEFLAIARGVRKRAFALRILTNGALVTDALAAEIAALRPLAVELSLHGATAETHDRATATPGSFDGLLRGVDRLLAHDVSVVLKTPLTRLNERETAGLRRIAEGRGVPWRIGVVLTPRDDGDAGPLAYRASAEAVERVFRELAALGQLPREERAAGGTNCGLGRMTIAVDPEGNAFPCLQWRRAPLGNVRETPLRETWAGSAERIFAASVARAANDRLVEAGGAVAAFPFCPALALQRTGDPLRPDESHRERASIAQRIRLDPR
jgi:MoaA/NifB/PqqE/SkfB family radical SAM enzyme